MFLIPLRRDLDARQDQEITLDAYIIIQTDQRRGESITKKIVSDVRMKGYVHRATKAEPQYFIQSDKTDHVAIHKGSALQLLKAATKKKARKSIRAHGRKPESSRDRLLSQSADHSCEAAQTSKAQTSCGTCRQAIPSLSGGGCEGL